MKEKLVIGTRGSKLAIVQAEEAKRAIVSAFPACDVEILPIKTSGDINKEANLAEIGGKGLFTKEIDEAVLSGRVDIAVHSLKDVPGIIAEGLSVEAVLERENPSDSLFFPNGNGIHELAQGAVLGTSSPRRRAQLLGLRPDLNIIPFRGNVPTRIKKVEEGQANATVLAAAGLIRLGLNQLLNPLSHEVMLPAISQGALGIICREDNDNVRNMLAKINHLESYVTTKAERATLIAFGGSCLTPLAAHATIENERINLRALIASPDGQHMVRFERNGLVNDAEVIGVDAGKELFVRSRGFL